MYLRFRPRQTCLSFQPLGDKLGSTHRTSQPSGNADLLSFIGNRRLRSFVDSRSHPRVHAMLVEDMAATQHDDLDTVNKQFSTYHARGLASQMK